MRSLVVPMSPFFRNSDLLLPSMAARDRHIAGLIRGCGLSAQQASGLNVGDVYSGKRVRRTLAFQPWPEGPLREVLLDRGLRESIAIILGCTAGFGYPLEPHLPLLLKLHSVLAGPPTRLSAEELQAILQMEGATGIQSDEGPRSAALRRGETCGV